LCEIKQAKETVQYSILFGDGKVACERDDTIFKYFYIRSSIVECEERRETTGIQIKKTDSNLQEQSCLEHIQQFDGTRHWNENQVFVVQSSTSAELTENCRVNKIVLFHQTNEITSDWSTFVRMVRKVTYVGTCSWDF
jgi:hypothetical protein